MKRKLINAAADVLFLLGLGSLTAAAATVGVGLGLLAGGLCLCLTAWLLMAGGDRNAG